MLLTMERRMKGNFHVRCGPGENLEIISKDYLSVSLGGADGQASDILIAAQQIQKCKDELYEIIVKTTGQTMEKVIADADRDCWMTSEEAKTYGIIDEVVTRS